MGRTPARRGSGSVDTGQTRDRRDTARTGRWSASGVAVAAVLAAATAAGCTSGTTPARGAAAPPPSASASGTASASALGGGTAPSSPASPGAQTSASGAGGTGAGQCPGAAMHTGSAPGGAATGHEGLILTFTNTGSATCTLFGYPGAVLAAADARAVMNATRTPSGFMGGAQGGSAPAAVTLAPGAVASALLEWEDVPTGPGAPVGANCPGMGATALLVTPPNTAATVSLPPVGACQALQIHPVVPGASGRTPGT